jgi:hypothetical protein
MANRGGFAVRSIAPAAVFVLLLALAGCATRGEIKTRLAELVGRPVKVAIDRLGLPTGQSSNGAKRAYFWVTNYSATVVTPEPPRQNFGILPPEGMSGFPVAGQDARYRIRCWIRLDVGPDDRIASYAWSGDPAGCGELAARLG